MTYTCFRCKITLRGGGGNQNTVNVNTKNIARPLFITIKISTILLILLLKKININYYCPYFRFIIKLKYNYKKFQARGRHEVI